MESPPPDSHPRTAPEVGSRAVLAPGTEIAGHRVRRELGRGTTAIVVEADPPGGGAPVALKVPLSGTADDPTVRARFLRGARAQAALAHPAVVRVHAVGESPVHGPWMAMELVRGATLGELLGVGELPGGRALRVLEQVAGALDAAHAAGVVHRDVKPSNVLVDGDRAWLADFGLARGDEDDEATTRAGAVIGTLPYLAPELVRGGPPSAAGDRYALAAVAHQLLVGETVFPRPTDAAILFAHVEEPPPAASARRPALPAAVDAVLARGLAKEPADRFPTATAFTDALRDALGPAAAQLPSPVPATRAEASTVDPPSGAAPAAPARDEAPPAHPAPSTAGDRRDAAGVTPPRRARPGRRLLLLGALAAAGAAAGVVVLVPAEDRGPARAADAVPPVGSGLVAIGSALDGPADELRGRDCRDRVPSGSSPACTVLQTELPGRRTVVPTTGAIRAWTVRGARGELVLQVLRRRGGEIFQVFRSQPTVVPDTGVHRYPLALPALAGDLVALAVLPGARVGLRPAAGARTERWFGPVSAQTGPGRTTGFAYDVQMRVELERGATVPPPRLLVGAEAARARAGREVAASETRLPDGRRVRVALVEVGGAVVVDLFRGGVRRARSVVPDLRPGGEVVEFKAFESPGNDSQLNVGWRNPGTRSDIAHYFGLLAESLEYYS
ncbi:hypothetical protein C7Y72_04735 [Paraconexibacter algicola]|uniref:non-specific serine/threonine protein kinase n=1 Tax=Paraconexibacter algicola TaxID=2133960 RepID=A0A2T4UID9_9ACTN|nr:hypothetical protein C7Y72_04735 [Paraconexibacter algicola]